MFEPIQTQVFNAINNIISGFPDKHELKLVEYYNPNNVSHLSKSNGVLLLNKELECRSVNDLFETIDKNQFNAVFHETFNSKSNLHLRNSITTYTNFVNPSCIKAIELYIEKYRAIKYSNSINTQWLYNYINANSTDSGDLNRKKQLPKLSDKLENILFSILKNPVIGTPKLTNKVMQCPKLGQLANPTLFDEYLILDNLSTKDNRIKLTHTGANGSIDICISEHFAYDMLVKYKKEEKPLNTNELSEFLNEKGFVTQNQIYSKSEGLYF